MVIVHDSDKYKYYDKQWKIDLIKYSNGVKTVYNKSAIYLPRRLYNGDGLFDNIVKFVSDNRDTIKNIAGVASSVSDSVKKIFTNAKDIVKKVRELKNKQPIIDDAMNKLLNANDTPKTGSGFFYV